MPSLCIVVIRRQVTFCFTKFLAKLEPDFPKFLSRRNFYNPVWNACAYKRSLWLNALWLLANKKRVLLLLI